MQTELPPEPAASTESTPEPASVAASAPIAAVLPSPEIPAYRDRSTGLVFFGVVQIILGLLAALMVPMVALGAFMSRLAPGGAMRPGQYFSGMATYAFAAAALLALGIGSVQMKRWARALTLVVSWYWLIVGVLITVLLTAVLPVIMRSAMRAQQNAAGSPSADLPTGVMAVVITLIIAFGAFFLVVVPIAFVVFYGRNDVKQTCHQRDSKERWTDHVPLPVLGASVVLFTGALYMLLVGLTTPLFPFFGKYLTGIPGAACFIALAALDIYLAVALFRLSTTGWWVAILTVPLRIASMALTYGRADLLQAYSKMGWSDQQIAVLSSNPILRSHVVLWWSLLSMVIFFGYLVWLKRFFKAPAVPPQVEALPAQVG